MKFLPRLRFSLRTLLLSALLFGSAFLLYVNRASFAVKFFVREKYSIVQAAFSPSDRYIYSVTYDNADQDLALKEIVRIYRSDTGRLCWELRCDYHPWMYSEYSFSPAENYFKRVSGYPPQSSSHGITPPAQYCVI